MRLIAVLIAFCVCLSSCGYQENEVSKEEVSREYVAERTYSILVPMKVGNITVMHPIVKHDPAHYKVTYDVTYADGSVGRKVEIEEVE